MKHETGRDQTMKEIDALVNIFARIKNDRNFTEYCPVYIFTTENISGYLNTLDVKDKDVLVPCASGDHILEAINKGAKSVDVFDINIYSYHMARLKIAAVKALSKEEFLNFFVRKIDDETTNEKIFDRQVYESKIRKCLPVYSRNFWDIAYHSWKKNHAKLNKSKNLLHSGLFIYDFATQDGIVKLLDYLKDDNYDKLKEKLSIMDEENIEFFNCDIVDIGSHLEKKYDIIMLSNIQDYANEIYSATDEITSLRKYREFIKNTLFKFLNKNGCIVGEYYYTYEKLSNLKSNSPEDILEVESVFNANGEAEKISNDGVVIYKN